MKMQKRLKYENHRTFKANLERTVPESHTKVPLYSQAHFKEQNNLCVEDLHKCNKKKLDENAKNGENLKIM